MNIPYYGNIINWERATWDVTYMTKYNSSYAEVCKDLKLEMHLIVLKQKLDLNSGNILCKAQKGWLNVIKDQENQNRVMTVMEKENCVHGKYIFDFFLS